VPAAAVNAMTYNVNGTRKLRTAVVAGLLLIALLGAVLVSIRTRAPALHALESDWAGGAVPLNATPAL
jgi:hypothetical protein